MPSGIRQSESGHFEARYEHPWGGVASDAAPMDIAPNQFQQCNGLTIKSGVLCTTTLDYTLSTPSVISFPVLQVFNIGQALYFLDSLGSIYSGVLVGMAPNNLYPNNFLVTNGACAGATCVQVINGIAYIFCYSSGSMYVFDPVAVTLVLGSTFVAGQYCCTVDQYLITANTNQPTDTPPLKTGRVNWSSPDGFTTWNPAVDRTSGFNVLTDVQDSITGCFAMGNVAYILREQGLTQMTPTGVAIAPFNFTSLWASGHGVGCTMPFTFDQYGYIACWANDTDIFVFSGSGAPTGICGTAKSAIYQDIYQTVGATQYAANFGQFFVGGVISSNSITTYTKNGVTYPITPDLQYSLFCISLDVSNSNSVFNIVQWIYKFKEKTWTRLPSTFTIPNVNSFNNMFPALASVYGAFPNNILSPNTLPNYRLVPLLCLSVHTSVYNQAVLSNYQASLRHPANTFSVSPTVLLQFRQEEFKFTGQPNIRGVAIKAQGTGTLTVNLTGNLNTGHRSTGVPTAISVNFTPVNLSTPTPVTLYSSGNITAEDLCCTISSTSFDGVIIKAAMIGTYADGETF